MSTAEDFCPVPEMKLWRTRALQAEQRLQRLLGLVSDWATAGETRRDAIVASRDVHRAALRLVSGADHISREWEEARG